MITRTATADEEGIDPIEPPIRRRGRGNPSLRRASEEYADPDEHEKRIKEIVTQNSEFGDIEQTIKKWSKEINRYEQIGKVTVTGIETVMSADDIGRKYGGGKYLIGTKFFEKTGEKKVTEDTIYLGEQYDAFVKPKTETGTNNAIEQAIQIASMTKNTSSDLTPLLDMQKETNKQMIDILQMNLSNKKENESSLDIAKAIGELSKLNNSGETTKLMMEMQTKMNEAILKATDKPDNTIALVSALSPVIAAIAAKPKEDNSNKEMMLSIAKMSETSNQNMMAMLSAMQQQNQQFMQLMVTQMNSASQAQMQLMGQMMNNKGDGLSNKLLNEFLPVMIAGAKPKDTMEDIMRLKELKDFLTDEKENDDEDKEEKSEKSMAKTLVEGLLAALPHIINPVANAATVATVMKQLPEAEQLRTNPQVRDQVSEQLKSKLTTQELQVLQYRTGVHFGVPPLSDTEYEAMIYGAVEDINSQNAGTAVEPAPIMEAVEGA